MRTSIEDFLQQNLLEMTRDVVALCRIPSVEGPAMPDAPFGTEVRRALDRALSISSRLGLRTVCDQGYAGHAEYGPEGDPLAVLVHLDVVPANAADWTCPPFDPVLRAGTLYARGVVDNKGPAVAALYAVAAVKNTNIQLKRPVRVIFGCDEESGWQDMAHYKAHIGLPREGFSPDASFPVINAEKGIAWISLDFDGLPDPNLIALWAGERPNMVPDTAYAQFRLPLSEDVLAAARKYGLSVQQDEAGTKLTATGVGAHGSRPEEGKNAAVKLMAFLHTHHLLSGAPAAMAAACVDVLADPTGKAAGIACCDQASGALTLNLGTLRADKSGCTAQLDVRYPVTHTLEEVLTGLGAALQGCTLTPGHCQNPLYVPADDPLVATLLDIYNTHTGSHEGPISIGGGTYARALEHGVAFGPLPADCPDTAHQADECITQSQLLTMAIIFAKAILQLCA
nr:Sapep family Mn(2+)-dependent dipeptidase [bacterium]